MPRKTKCVQDAPAQETRSQKDPQPNLTVNQPAANEESSVNGRTAQGRFAKGNPGGPGNPHARHCARMLELFRNAISDEEMFRLVRKLFEKAEAGDTSAAKI